MSKTETSVGNCATEQTSQLHVRRTSRFSLFVACLAISICGIGIWELRNGLARNWLVGLFGPPRVTLQESFANISDGSTFDHSTFDGVLKRIVDEDGWVDYELLKKDTTQLEAYVRAIASADLSPLGRDERLAFLINAYNAFTLTLIVENFPLTSIKDIPEAERWDAVRWILGGKRVSLNQIEHELIRPNFKEPRIHFALVCAAIGCPPLRNEAFTGLKLERQLAGQAEFVHSHKTWFEYSEHEGLLRLTQLYNWYGDDFVQVAGAVEKHAGTYAPRLRRDLESGKRPAIKWLDYDWTLNDKANKSPR